MELDEASENLICPSLIKGLASTNASIRSKTLKPLFNWLPTQTLISDNDLKRLWKSLFYCMWHSDKIQNQTKLINRLSSVIPVLSPQLSLSYFSHFIITMRREWPGIDHLRLDKFYVLVRHFVRNMFNLMKKMSWDLATLEKFVLILEKDLFFFNDDNDVDGSVKGLGNGVTYHVASLFCDEIKLFLPLSMDVLNLLFRPFFGILGWSDNKVLLGKVKNHVFDFLLKSGKGLLEAKRLGAELVEKDEMVLFGTVGLAMGFSTRLYELGSSEDCIQGNRKVVLGLYEEFLWLEKEKASLGIDVTLPEAIDDEVLQLIPINGEVNGSENVSEGENTKKSKELKKETKDKKSKKKKKKYKKQAGITGNDGASGSESNGDTEMSDNSNAEVEGEVNELVVSEDVISNLQKQFEKIAAEAGLDGASSIESPPVPLSGKAKKRKRSKSVALADTSGKDGDESAANTEGKSGKRVRFAMKNNLVWKPSSPLPPQSVRIPPSSTPHGNALKKGVSPGPIRDASQDVKKAKKKKKPSPLKKAKKVKTISAGGKHGKKGKPMSA